MINAAYDVHTDDPEFGHRFIADELAASGHSASERRVWRLCSQQELFSHTIKRARKRGQKPGPPVCDDLVERGFTAQAVNELWLTDITEHHTGEGKLYMCAVKDVFSNRIVGYAIDSRMKSRLAVEAIDDAVARRGGPSVVAGCLVHSDRGVQGGFNWSSQHLEVRKVFKDGDQGLEHEDQRGPGGDAAAVARGPGVAASNALSGQTAAIEGGAATILAPDRGRGHDSGGSAGGGGVGAGRITVVPSRWRHKPQSQPNLQQSLDRPRRDQSWMKTASKRPRLKPVQRRSRLVRFPASSWSHAITSCPADSAASTHSARCRWRLSTFGFAVYV